MPVSGFEQTPAAADESSASAGSGAEAATEHRVSEPGVEAAPATPLAAALRELDTLAERDLAEHPDVYQRIHAELQSALATIDNA